MSEGYIDKSIESSASFPLDKMTKARKGYRSDADAGGGGRVPPFNEQAERQVLGAILLERSAIEKVIEVFGDEQEQIFYEGKHRTIYKSMMTLYQRREPIDILTLSDELRRNEQLENVEGQYYIAALTNTVATAANVQYHAKIVKEKYLHRRLISLATQMAEMSFNESEDAFQLVEKASQEIFKISQAGTKKRAAGIKDILKQAVQVIETLQRKGSSVTGVSSGFFKLDELTAGFQASDLVIIAARPSTGKTALALAFARNAAVDYQTPVLFFSLEMAELQLGMRLLCAEAMADAQQVRTGKISAADTTRIASRLDKISRAEIYVDDTPGISIIELAAKARRMKQEKKIGMIVIDYLQLVTPVRDNKSNMNREQEIAQISRTLKALAKELMIPIISLAQLSRAVESRTGDKRPQLSDLRESGSIEQDADMVMFLSRPEMYGKQQFEDGTSTKDIIELIIGKQRNGPIGDVRLKFIKQYARFENLDTNYTNYAVSEGEVHKSDMAARRLEQENERPAPPPPDINADNAPF
jgi:replicative DNA helicase